MDRTSARLAVDRPHLANARGPAAAGLRAAIQRVALRTVGIAVADLIAQGLRIFVMFASIGWTNRAMMAAEIGRNSLLLAFGLALALEIHEAPALRAETAKRWAALGLAVLAAVVASCLVIRSDTSVMLGIAASERALRLHVLWNNGMVAVVTVAYLTRRRESLEAEQRRRALASRLGLARGRLQAITVQTEQTRVAPQMMFDCLTRARDVYPVDLSRGDALLDKLTRYLRLTFGIASDGEATLAREAELAAAWIDVQRCDADAPMELHVAPALAGIRFPAGVLGPLAHEWLQDPLAPPPRALRLHTEHDDETLCVWLVGPCPVPEATLKRAALGLEAFGIEGIALEAAANRLCIRMAIPRPGAAGT